MSDEQPPQPQEPQQDEPTIAEQANALAARRSTITLFCAGLTARMGFKQQKTASKYVEILLYAGSFVAFWIGHHFQSFRIVLYIVSAIGLLACVLFVPNWAAAVKSAEKGFSTIGEDTNFLRAKLVNDYYTTLRQDELRVEPHRRPPPRH